MRDEYNTRSVYGVLMREIIYGVLCSCWILCMKKMSNRSKKEDESNMVISRNKRLDKKLQEEDLLEMEEYPKFYVRWIDEDIGGGVFAKQEFQRGDCLLEYKGIFSTSDEVKDDTYVFEINHKGKSYM
ncbi:hypothetical protein CHS0354_035550 [Potamilus streckersoni]|uniref:Uncharacterized protein n=1 Tax=Potamilus streckersoni TaxID=2493646 RepID=A0AAE0RSQ5_9BIVA|nr:hypothetical protein CHS0354_035550 [Potamilus streckersoni]